MEWYEVCVHQCSVRKVDIGTHSSRYEWSELGTSHRYTSGDVEQLVGTLLRHVGDKRGVCVYSAIDRWNMVGVADRKASKKEILRRSPCLTITKDMVMLEGESGLLESLQESAVLQLPPKEEPPRTQTISTQDVLDSLRHGRQIREQEAISS